MTNVCSLSLSPRAVMKSIPKSGFVLLVQGWQLRSHFIPAHQRKRYKKNGSPCERFIPGYEIWSKYNAGFGKRFTGYGISLLPRKRDSPNLDTRCMIGKIAFSGKEWRKFPGWGGGGVLGFIFARYVPLASQNPHPTIIYFVAIL